MVWIGLKSNHPQLRKPDLACLLLGDFLKETSLAYSWVSMILMIKITPQDINLRILIPAFREKNTCHILAYILPMILCIKRTSKECPKDRQLNWLKKSTLNLVQGTTVMPLRELKRVQRFLYFMRPQKH